MKKMWGGIFNKDIEKSVLNYTSSIHIDKLLAQFDIDYSMVHAKALEKADVISKQELDNIVKNLEILSKELKQGKIKLPADVEDIHTFVEDYLCKELGDIAYKLHAGRSRNDQVMVAVRLFCKENLGIVIEKLNKLIKSFLIVADKNKDIIIPAYTHLQHAQPVLLSHYLLAYVNMFKRDKERLNQTNERLDMLPAGSAACSGTSVDLDLTFIAKQLGFSKVAENSLDAVSDRDFIIEILAELSILFMHFSRLSEDFILWYSQEFNIINIDDSFCTGSSIMPHKKNPDILELIRGSSSKMYGKLFSILTLLKGLPLSYNRDLQLDKEFLFPGIDITVKTLDMLTTLLDNITINKNRTEELLEDEKLYITDVAEYLVHKGMAFREAHKIVGNIYKYCMDNNLKFLELSLDKLKEFSELFDKEIFEIFDAAKSIENKVTSNSTNPEMVSGKISKLLKEFK